ncbi:barrier to autointegration factor, partial [Ancylostoma duodenale]
AYILFGQFLLLKKDEELFTEWLKDTAGVSSQHAKSAYNCLNAWAEQFI